MKQELRAIRGMNDVAPPASVRWQRLEQRVARVLAAYGYQQIRLPIVESTGVFERSIGDTTYIVCVRLTRAPYPGTATCGWHCGLR